jgi:CRP/FNR family cyclic AMP-dependent transcriptional regulator
MTSALAACSELPILRFAPGDVLLQEGARDNRLFFLLNGEVKVVRGSSRVAHIGMPGAVFGEMSALLDIPYSASVIAVKETRAHVSDDASAFIESHPAISIHLARTLAQRLYNTTGYLADIKRQFSDQSDHLGMVDVVLEELLQQQRRDAIDLSESATDPRL